MNKNLTDITVILDRSGSMAMLKNSTISGYNEFKEQQAAADGECIWTEVQFSSPNFRFVGLSDDNGYEVTVSPTPVGAVRDLDNSTYRVGGMTALYDAIGATIDNIGTRLSALPEADRPGTVIVVITTDGQENASTKYGSTQIKKMIEHQETKYDWQFIFMAANQDAIKTADGLGIQQDAALSYAANDMGQKAAYMSLSANIGATRSLRSAGIMSRAEFSAEDRSLQYRQGADDQLNSAGSA